MTELPPRITRAEAVWPDAIKKRMYDIEQALDRSHETLAAHDREGDELLTRHNNMVAEWNRLQRKLLVLEEGAGD